MKESRNLRSEKSILKRICREHYLEDASYRLRKKAQEKKEQDI